VRVARRGKVTHDEVAHDVNVSLSSLTRWRHRADLDDGRKGGLTSTEQDEVVQRRRDNRRLVMENEIVRRAAADVANDALPT
jgi:transposase